MIVIVLLIAFGLKMLVLFVTGAGSPVLAFTTGHRAIMRCQSRPGATTGSGALTLDQENARYRHNGAEYVISMIRCVQAVVVKEVVCHVSEHHSAYSSSGVTDSLGMIVSERAQLAKMEELEPYRNQTAPLFEPLTQYVRARCRHLGFRVKDEAHVSRRGKGKM